jgi:hypothetical protein
VNHERSFCTAGAMGFPRGIARSGVALVRARDYYGAVRHAEDSPQHPDPLLGSR